MELVVKMAADNHVLDVLVDVTTGALMFAQAAQLSVKVDAEILVEKIARVIVEQHVLAAVQDVLLSVLVLVIMNALGDVEEIVKDHV